MDKEANSNKLVSSKRNKYISHISNNYEASLDSKLVLLGRNPEDYQGNFNTPLFETSTVVFSTYSDYLATQEGANYGRSYGRAGTITTQALEDAIANLENAYGSLVASSGIMAIVSVFFSLLKAGDHILITDAVYHQVKSASKTWLAKFGVECEFYHPHDIAGLEKKIKANTKMIYVESPASITYEIQDIPAITSMAKKHGIMVVADSTWCSSIATKILDLGVDISIVSGTKFYSGSNDVFVGVISAKNKEHYELLRSGMMTIGSGASPYACYMVLRSLRTLNLRWQRSYKTALDIANWIESEGFVDKVLYPPLQSHSHHEIWKRDYQSAAGIFSLVMPKWFEQKHIEVFLDSLQYFSIGLSWGGYDNLVMASRIESLEREHIKYDANWIVRLYFGFSDEGELMQDIKTAFEKVYAIK